jgi:hypothetical protein
MDNLKDINIRAFEQSDFEQIAEIIVYSYQEKIKKLTNLKDNELKDFLIKIGWIVPCPFPGYFVAGKKNNEVV